MLVRVSHRSSVWALLCLASIALNSGCNSSSTSSNNAQQPSNENKSEIVANTRSNSASNSQNSNIAIVSNFADRVVIPSYRLLVQRSDALSKAVDTFANNPQDTSLKTARNAWANTRTSWEQTETFAFGPAESLGYDGDLDDWPVNQTDVTAVLKSSDKIDTKYVADRLQTTQKGFHTIELLLFGENNNKTAKDFSSRDLELLKALTTAFNQTAINLEKSWSTGVQGNPAYQEVLATAGSNDNTTYPTVNAAIEEIVQGMIGCLDEVANEKIGEPLKTKENIGFESRFSHSSLNDFKNNLQGVQNAYLGTLPGSDSNSESISTMVAKADGKLDEKVKSELKEALDALNTVPDPIEPKIEDKAAETKLASAQQAILTLHKTMVDRVLPLVQSSKS